MTIWTGSRVAATMASQDRRAIWVGFCIILWESTIIFLKLQDAAV